MSLKCQQVPWCQTKVGGGRATQLSLGVGTAAAVSCEGGSPAAVGLEGKASRFDGIYSSWCGSMD